MSPEILHYLAIAPLFILGFMVYLALFWLLPSIDSYGAGDTVRSIIGAHLLGGFIIWLIWGCIYLMPDSPCKENISKKETSSIITNEVPLGIDQVEKMAE